MVEKTTKDINPNSVASKSLEMTVLRALQLIEAFDALGEGEDWTDVPNATYRNIIGPRYLHGRMLEECWNRHQRGTLYAECLALYENLPPAAQKRKEIQDGKRRIDARLNSGGERPTVRPARRTRGTKR